MENGKKIMVKIVATTSLPVDRLTATDCNAAARAKKNVGEKTFLVPTFLKTQHSVIQIFFDKMFNPKIILYQKISGQKFFGSNLILGQKYFRVRKFFG